MLCSMIPRDIQASGVPALTTVGRTSFQDGYSTLYPRYGPFDPGKRASRPSIVAIVIRINVR